jgi:propionate CoA-transferase
MLRMHFIDFRQLTITSNRDVERIKAEVERRIEPLGHKVYAIVNYRDCRVEPAVQASYRRMVESRQRGSSAL